MLQRRKPRKRLYKLDTTNSLELIELARRLKVKLVQNKIFMRDEIPRELPEGNYIMNLQESSQGGSHWTAFIKDGRNVFYNDSYGIAPPETQTELFKYHKLKLYYNDQQNQLLEATSCGYWALFWLEYMNNKQNGKTLMQRFDKWNKLFSSTDQEENEKKLLIYANKILT